MDDLKKAGFVRIRVGGYVRELTEEIKLDKNKKHNIEAVVDRIITGDESNRARIADSVETALKLGGGVVLIAITDGEELLFSEHFACVHCGISLGEIAPRTFSFNSPHGACPTCTGLGIKLEIDPDLVVPNRELSISEGAIRPWSTYTWYLNNLEDVADRFGFSLKVPFKKLTREQADLVLYGENPERHKYRNRFGKVREYAVGFEGVIPNLERLYKETESENRRMEIQRYMSASPCPVCQGKRLKPETLSILIDKINIMDVTAMSAVEASAWVQGIMGERNGEPVLTPNEKMIAQQIVKEIDSRLGFLKDIGLGYLTLDRSSVTLSGGESQRIRLATMIGSGLMGVLYICDEPTIGLHPADIHRLINTMNKLRDLGNTVISVEHDEAMMRAADYIVDLGPGAGEHGGRVVATGTIEDIMNSPESVTGQYLSKAREIAMPESRREGSGKYLVIKGARENNLKNITVKVPMGKLVCIAGVSGSGKSTLMNDVLYKKLAQVFYKSREKPGKCDSVTGIENMDKVINIDQSPIGRTPRSNPATYTGAFTPIRELFASVPEARVRGYGPGRFSFNVRGGRCEACQGEGYIQIEMQFLPDVTVPCEVCKGKRYNREALEIQFKGKTIADVLDMTIEEATAFFEHFPKIKNKLATLNDVGLGYMRLGQPAPTLSGGEAQRVKLASELSRRSTGRTVYILDEPTTGLSFADIDCLLQVLQRLVSSGNTVIIIEHNLDVIKNADHIIDLGPGAGDEGGYLIAEGTPEEVAGIEDSATGRYLKDILKSRRVLSPSLSKR
jgi:excinuclease ABC subunit A